MLKSIEQKLMSKAHEKACMFNSLM